MSVPFLTIRRADFSATIDTGGQVAYRDRLTPEAAIEHVKANIDRVPVKVRPVVEFALTAACRSVLLKKGTISEAWFLTMPLVKVAEKAELAPFGRVDRYGHFFFDQQTKMDALEWIKYRADRGELNFHKRNAHYYAADLGDLGMVIIDKMRRNYGGKPWLVKYALPEFGPVKEAKE